MADAVVSQDALQSANPIKMTTDKVPAPGYRPTTDMLYTFCRMGNALVEMHPRGLEKIIILSFTPINWNAIISLPGFLFCFGLEM